jgi:predicted nucleic acid-binding protein
VKGARDASRALHVAEPPANYLVRPPVVVDCSAICAVLFDEPERADAATQKAGKTLYAPYLLDHEVISVALKKRRLQWPAESLALALDAYDTWQIEMRETNPLAQYELAARYQLSAYDAAYLWLAGELKAPLATFDEKLAKAARAHLAGLA